MVILLEFAQFKNQKYSSVFHIVLPVLPCGPKTLALKELNILIFDLIVGPIKLYMLFEKNSNLNDLFLGSTNQRFGAISPQMV